MSILESARNLRRNQTPEEILLWEHIRNRKLSGYKFRRQYIIAQSYIADFYCAEKKLVIEIDGGIHNEPEVLESDKLREETIKSWGYEVIRFTNKQVNKNIESVLSSLLERLNML